MSRAIHTLKIPVGQLKPGMYVCELDRPWHTTPFRCRGYAIATAEDILVLRGLCKHVYVRVSKTKPSFGLKTPGAGVHLPFGRRAAALAEEFPAARQTYRRTIDLVKNMLDDVRLGRVIDMHGAKRCVAECVDSLLRHPEALLWLTQIREKDEYTAQHSLNVCVYAAAFAHFLGHPREKAQQFGLCGLLHDVGKIAIPPDILNKDGGLDRKEFAVMQTHTTEGRNILMSCRDLLPEVIEVAHAHHERLNGSGYPRGMDGARIPLPAKLIAVVDTYDAVTSDRCYQPGRTHAEALDILRQGRLSHFDGELVAKFVRFIGAYPPGLVVEMDSGEVGIVVRSNPREALRPTVAVVLDGDKRPCPPSLVDLAESGAAGRLLRVRNVLRCGAYGVDPRRFPIESLCAAESR
jgi:putative nucleotidyltransferase with HDIG domain